jgi:hypothetical protein
MGLEQELDESFLLKETSYMDVTYVETDINDG